MTNMASVLNPTATDTASQLATLELRVKALEMRLEKTDTPSSNCFDIAPILPELMNITQEIFPGEARVNLESDPEFPEETYFVVDVQASGTSEEILNRRGKWHERVRQVSPDCFGNVRLSITPE